MIYDCVIVGCGAAGLYCASRIVSQKQLSVAIIDSNSIAGKKLLMTGSGRCNLTNSSISLSNYHCDDMSKLDQILTLHNYQDTIDFFDSELGMKCVSKGKLYYPITLRASTVVESLVMYLKDHNVDFVFDTKVRSVTRDNDDYIINSSIRCRSIVFACGGASYPKTGSDGSYLGFLTQYFDKSSFSQLLPSLVPLKTFEKDIFALKGLRFKCSVKLYRNNSSASPVASSKGEILFTDYGVSGICIFDVSGYAVRSVSDGDKPVVSIDFLEPESLSIDDIRKNLLKFPDRSIIDSLGGLIQKELLAVVLKRVNISSKALSVNLTENDIENIYKCLTDFELIVKGSMGLDNAQVTTGGIKLSSVGNNLEIPGLSSAFICGESLDCDGICGGYNLQFAWSSADLAAKGVLGCLN